MDATTLTQDLARDYGLAVTDLRPHPGGFDTHCFVADGTWFIKVWCGSEPPARLHLLGELNAAGLPVPAPLATPTGELHAWSSQRPYAVFEFVRGRTAQHEDWPQTAQTLQRVHALRDIDLPDCSMDEPEIWQLEEHLDHPWIKGRRREVAASIQRLRRAIERAEANAVPRVVRRIARLERGLEMFRPFCA